MEGREEGGKSREKEGKEEKLIVRQRKKGKVDKSRWEEERKEKRITRERKGRRRQN